MRRRTDRRLVADRFWEKVCKTEKCWLWTGTRNNGYGVLQVGTWQRSKMVPAHRLAWELAYGAVPDGLQVCHDCPDGDNPACVNPSHLYLGTARRNALDASRKGTLHQGEAHPHAILTADLVRRIRAHHALGTGIGEISRMFGLKHQHVSKIVSRQLWHHI